jgi:uridine kinase
VDEVFDGWFDETLEGNLTDRPPPQPPTIVGVCGGSGSGKTTLARRLVESLGPGTALHLSFDAYYRDLAHLPLADRARMNFDHPDSLDADLLVDHLRTIRAGREIAVPVYDFATYVRTGGVDLVEPRSYVIVEGVLLLAFPEVRRQLDVSIFRHCDEAVRAERRFRRDVAERGRTPQSVRRQWATTVQPMYELHVEPNAHHAELSTADHETLDDAVHRLTTALRDRAPARPPVEVA